MRSIALHLDLSLRTEAAPIDVFSIRDSDEIFYDPPAKQTAGCVDFLNQLADCVEQFSGRLRLSITFSGATANALYKAGAIPIIQRLSESGCVQFCAGTQDRVASTDLTHAIVKDQLSVAASNLNNLIGSVPSTSTFGDANALPTQALLVALQERGAHALLFNPRNGSNAAVLRDTSSGILGIPVSLAESNSLNELLTGQGIPGQVTQQLRNSADQGIPIVNVSPHDYTIASLMLPRWLYAVFSDPKTRMLTVDEALLRMPRIAEDLKNAYLQPSSAPLANAARRQLLALIPLISSLNLESTESIKCVRNWHKLLGRHLYKFNQPTPCRKITGQLTYDSYVKISTAIAMTEHQLRIANISNPRQ